MEPIVLASPRTLPGRGDVAILGGPCHPLDVLLPAVLAAVSAAVVLGLHTRRRQAEARLRALLRDLGSTLGPASNGTAVTRRGDHDVAVRLDAWRSGRLVVRVTRPEAPLPELVLEVVAARRPKKRAPPFAPDENAALTIEESVPDELRAAARPGAVETHDEAFDQAILAIGGEGEALALLDHAERGRLLELRRTGEVAVERRALSAAVDARTLDPAAIGRWLDLTIGAAAHLVALAPDAERARLARNALEDPDPRVRARNLDALLARHPGTAEAARASDRSLAGDVPEPRLVAALHADRAGLPHLARLAAAPEVPDYVRAAALEGLATAAPADHLDLFAAALGSESSLVQVAAVAGLDRVELGHLPLAAVLDRLDHLEPEALAAALALLERANEADGEHLAPDLRQRAIRALVEHGALAGAEAGRLGVVPRVEGGALSLDEEGGAVSLPTRSPPGE